LQNRRKLTKEEIFRNFLAEHPNFVRKPGKKKNRSISPKFSCKTHFNLIARAKIM